MLVVVVVVEELFVLGSLIKSFSIPPEMELIYEKFREIIRKDKKVVISGKEYDASSASEAFSQFILVYVQGHSDNPVPRIDKWMVDPDYIALPTLAETMSQDRLSKMDYQTLKEIVSKGQDRVKEAEGELKRRSPHPKQAPIPEPMETCPYCGKRMLSGHDAHYYSQVACGKKAVADALYDGPISSGFS